MALQARRQATLSLFKAFNYVEALRTTLPIGHIDALLNQDLALYEYISNLNIDEFLVFVEGSQDLNNLDFTADADLHRRAWFPKPRAPTPPPAMSASASTAVPAPDTSILFERFASPLFSVLDRQSSTDDLIASLPDQTVASLNQNSRAGSPVDEDAEGEPEEDQLVSTPVRRGARANKK